MCSYIVLMDFNEKVQYQSLQQRTEDALRGDGLQEDNLGQLPVHHPLIKDRMSDEGLSVWLVEPQFLRPLSQRIGWTVMQSI